MMQDIVSKKPTEFSLVLSCTGCTKIDDTNLLRDSGENVPQPGYIGHAYQTAGVLLVGQNPGLPSPNLLGQDLKYTASLRRLRDDPIAQNYNSVHRILEQFIPSWPVRGQYFPLSECGLSLETIAYCNLVRCRTAGNAKPNDLIAHRCTAAHFSRWLTWLKPRCVIFIGLWAQRRGASECTRQNIPFTAMNRNRSLPQEDRTKNRAEVARFVRSILAGEAVTEPPPPRPLSAIVPLQPNLSFQREPTPQGALFLLQELQKLGFPNEAFRRIHHASDSIHGFSSHCRKIGGFQSGSKNEVVFRRLAFVLERYRAGGFTASDTAAFIELAQLAAATVR